MALSTGYTLNWDNIELRLSGALNYTSISVDGYQEKNAGLAPAAAVEPMDLEQLLSNLSADFSWSVNTSFGVVIPQMSLGWEHHYSDDTFEVNGALIGDTSSTVFSYESQVQDTDYLTWMMGVSTVFKHGVSAYATIEGYSGRSDVKSHRAFIGIRVEL